MLYWSSIKVLLSSMIIVCYDISDDKLRTKFAKFLCEYGTRLQYSVFEIENSERVLNIISEKLKKLYEKKFTGTDSVVMFRFNEREVIRFGNAKHREDDLLII